MDLLTLGIALPPVAAVPLTRVNRDPAENSDIKSVDIDRVLRRHGRALLLGPPGAGKSVMLRWLAAREAARGWSTPVLVDLRALLDPAGAGGRPLRLDAGIDPVDTLVELAATVAPFEDRELLYWAIRAAAVDGSLLICLDSLDETREHRHAAVSWLRRLTKRVHADCNIVVATRTSAYAAAATLGWRELWIAPFRHIEQVAIGVLRGFATRDGQDSDWVQTRLTWVTDKASQFPALGDTPLLVTALAIEAAQRSSLDEVTGPAQLLERITGWIASNWERRSDRIGTALPTGLLPAQVSDALRCALARLAWAVVSHAEPPNVEPTKIELSEEFAAEHGLPAGQARALATSAVHFWDEAGIIVLDHDGRLAARSRPVVEVSAARYIAGLPPTNRIAAIASLAAEPTTFEVLRLLVSLEQGSVDDVVQVTVASGTPELLMTVADALTFSTGAAPRAVANLVEALAAIPAAGEADRAAIVRSLAGLPAPPADRDRIVAIIDTALPPAAAAVWRALLLHRWADPTAADACRAVTLAGPPPRPPRPQHLTVKQAILFPNHTGEAFGRVVLATTGQLTAGDEDLAETIRQLAYHHCPAKISDDIYRELGRRGFRNDEPTERRRQWEGTSTAQDNRFQTAFTWLLEHLAEADQSYDLRIAERRRLDHLSRLNHGLAIGEFGIGEFETAVENNKADVAAIIDVFLDRGCFDRAAIAAEAASFLTEFHDDRFAWLYLTYEPPKCVLTCWDGADVPQLIASAAPMFQTGHWFASLAAIILTQIPESYRPTAATAAAAQAEAGIPPHQRRLAALAALLTETTRFMNRWRRAPDPVLVSAVMECADGQTDRLVLLVEGLGHQDVLVREQAVDQLSAADTTQRFVRDALRLALALPIQGTCRYCGRSFAGRTLNCEHCGLALPDPRSKIDSLLRAANTDVVDPTQFQ